MIGTFLVVSEPLVVRVVRFGEATGGLSATLGDAWRLRGLVGRPLTNTLVISTSLSEDILCTDGVP